MSYRVVFGNQPLGTSELEYHDSAVGMAFGTFHPLAPYQAVRPVFLQFTEALPSSSGTPDEYKLAEYYTARVRLGLALETEEGTTLTTGFIHILDWGEAEEDHIEIEVQVLDPRFVWTPSLARGTLSFALTRQHVKSRRATDVLSSSPFEDTPSFLSEDHRGEPGVQPVGMSVNGCRRQFADARAWRAWRAGGAG